MSLLSKLKHKKEDKKEEEKQYIKEDIYIFVQNVKDDTTVQDGYVMIGMFNEDETKFKDLLTGKIYDISSDSIKRRPSEITDLEVEGRKYGQLRKFMNFYGRFDNRMEFVSDCENKQPFIHGREVGYNFWGFRYKRTKYITEFLEKYNWAPISLKLLRKVAKELNEIIIGGIETDRFIDSTKESKRRGYDSF